MIEPTSKQVIESLQSALRTLGAEKDAELSRLNAKISELELAVDDANLSKVSDREECELLRKNNANLKTVMIAAAEEIHKHWQAHCDSEGYGPANLMRRLEEGIPAEYGYTAGAFSELEKAWQPIETAPKDGTHILATLALGRGFGKGHDWCDVVHWFNDPQAPGFYSSYSVGEQESPFGFLTHWMPLPNVPAGNK